MTDAPHVCPVCGSRAKLEGFRVSLEENVIVADGRSLLNSNTNRKMVELAYLLLHDSPSVVRRDRIMTALYGMQVDPPFDKIIDVYICRLRKMMRDTPYRIVTVWGVGWRLVRVKQE